VIRVIKPEEIFQYWEELSTSDITRLHPIKELSWQFGKVASGELSAVGFFEDEVMKGLIIFETQRVPVNGSVELKAVTRQIYGPHNTRRYAKEFADWLHGQGYKKFGGITMRNGDAMARLIKGRVVYSYVEREV